MVPRMLRLQSKTRERLERERRAAERDGAYRVAKRIHAVLLNAQGHTSGRIADLLRAPRSRVADWLAGYEVYGFESLLEGQRSGRPRQLGDAQRITLADIIDSGPVAYGLDTGVWTSPMIARLRGLRIASLACLSAARSAYLLGGWSEKAACFAYRPLGLEAGSVVQGLPHRFVMSMLYIVQEGG